MNSRLPKDLLQQCERLKPLDIIIGVLCKDVEPTVLNVLNVVNEGLHQFFPDYRKAIVISEGESFDQTEKTVELFQPYNTVEKISTKDLLKGGKGAGILTIFEIAHATDAKCIALLDGDLLSIKPVWIQTILNPIIYGRADLTVPYYIRDKYDAVITNNFVYPVTRTLYGVDIRQPIAGEFALSQHLYEKLLKHPLFPLDFGIDIFIVTVAAAEKMKIKEGLYSLKIHESTMHYLEPEKLLVPMFKKVTRTMFELAMYYENVWQHRPPVTEPVSIHVSFSKKPIPVKIDIEKLNLSFIDEYIALRSTMRKFLPEMFIARLDYITQGHGSLDNELWAEIVYQYMIAYKRLRTDVQRKLLFDTLKVLWIGRFISYAIETQKMSINQAEEVIQRQAEAFEQKFAYFKKRYAESISSSTETLVSSRGDRIGDTDAYVCSSCDRRIINPVCPTCRLEELQAWLRDQDLAAEKKTLLLDKAAQVFPLKSESTVPCISCKKNTVSMCTYCFFLKFEKILRSSKVSDEVIQSYWKVFNYRIYQKDFSSF
jgi:glycosyltransferase involved in cell wall biosynthesis